MQIDNSRWVFVLVQQHDTGEQIVGQVDAESQVNFIPTFLDRESAQQAITYIPKDRGKKLEIQAIIFEDLSYYASKNHFLIFILDENGNLLSTPTPSPDTHPNSDLSQNSKP